mgnify:FL=1
MASLFPLLAQLVQALFDLIDLCDNLTGVKMDAEPLCDFPSDVIQVLLRKKLFFKELLLIRISKRSIRTLFSGFQEAL